MFEENWITAYAYRERLHAYGVWHSSQSADSFEQRQWDTEVTKFIENTYFNYFMKRKERRHICFGTKSTGLNMALASRYIAQLFSKVRFVIVIRDPRDTYASMKNSPRMIGPIPRNFYEDSINSPDLVELSVHSFDYWGRVYDAVRALLSEIPNHCYLLRYEALLANPEEEVSGLCEFLSVKFDTSMLRPFCCNISNASVVSMSEDDYLAGNFKISKSPIGRWRKDLSLFEQHKLSTANSAVAQYFGYTI